MKLHENDVTTVILDTENSVIEQHWSDKEITEEEYKTDQLLFLDLVREHRPKYGLVDTRKFRFTISIELQEWVAKEITGKAVQLGMQKAAFLLPSELIAQISIEQTIDEGALSENVLSTQYFDDKNDAMEWLLSDD